MLPDQASDRPDADGDVAERVKRPVVLIVEDDIDIRETMVELLCERGFDAFGAVNGEAGIAKLRELVATTPPCLVLLDVMMPVMNAEMFRAAQLADPAIAGIPVVLMSAYRDVAGQARALGVEYVTKPIGIAALIATIRRYCS
jgi:CheY-like chemotaxis protein